MERTYPMPTAEMNVPKNANVRMTPKLRKKFSCLSSYPELRMMGGSSRLKKRVCLNICAISSAPSVPILPAN